MSLREQLEADLKVAQKSHEEARLSTLRLIKASLSNREIEKRAKAGADASLTDEEVMEVLQREAKKRREAIDIYTTGGRADLRAQEEAELAIIAVYLPRQLGKEEIELVIAELKAKGFTEFNTLMKEAMKELKGKADGKLVGEIIRSHVA